MAKFPPNLDDGELWLPSDIFLNELPSKQNPYQTSLIDDLAAHFPALSLLQNQPPIPPFYCQRLKPAVPYSSTIQFSPEFGRRMCGCENGSCLVQYKPGSEIRTQSPVRKPGSTNRFDRCLELRNRVLQRPQMDPSPNRVNPFQRDGFGIRGGRDSSAKESSGTGVFHPRVVTPAVAGREIKRKQCVRSRQQESHEISQQNSNMEVNKQEECHYYLPPDLGLPQDWTY